MRATINLPDALAEAAEERARSEGRTFTSLVEEGLRTVLAHDEGPAKVDPLPAYGHAEGRFLVDITDRDALWAALDTDDLLPDVNVLVYAYRREARNHAAYASWLAGVVAGQDEFALADHWWRPQRPGKCLPRMSRRIKSSAAISCRTPILRRSPSLMAQARQARPGVRAVS
ncbi:MAG TPA: hypothetical protein VH561_05790 [Micromonosporaceae bacterium]